MTGNKTIEAGKIKKIVVATYHREYRIEQFGYDYYVRPPGQRDVKDQVSVKVVYDGCFAWLRDLTTHPLPPGIINPADLEIAKKWVGDDALHMMTIYSIIGNVDSIKALAEKIVAMLIERIPWLDYEDDHCDFYHSTIELVGQIAEHVDFLPILYQLHAAVLERYGLHGCPYCDENNLEECTLIGVFDGHF